MLDSSLIFKGNEIYVNDPDVWSVYNKLRSAVMDAQIPVTVPIGFKLVSPTNNMATTAIERNSSCLESMIAISINVSNIIFTGDFNTYIDSEICTGVVTTGTAGFKSKGKTDVEAINKDTKMFTAIDNVSIRFYVNTACGYMSMAKNAALMGASDFFPLNSMHSIINYVSILPLAGKIIRVRYRNGMTAQIFEKLVKGAK